MSSEDTALFRYNLKRLMTLKGWKLDDLANHTPGLTIHALRQYSAGYREPDPKYRRMLAASLEVPVSEFYRPEEGEWVQPSKHLPAEAISEIKSVIVQETKSALRFYEESIRDQKKQIEQLESAMTSLQIENARLKEKVSSVPVNSSDASKKISRLLTVFGEDGVERLLKCRPVDAFVALKIIDAKIDATAYEQSRKSRLEPTPQPRAEKAPVKKKRG